MSKPRIGTPCIGVCSTVFGDTVCRGCRRFSHEVVDWNAYSDEQKRIVWERLDELLGLVVSNYFEVVDADALAGQLDYQNLRYQTQLSPTGWVPELLKAAGRQRIDYRVFGLEPLPAAEGLARASSMRLSGPVTTACPSRPRSMILVYLPLFRCMLRSMSSRPTRNSMDTTSNNE